MDLSAFEGLLPYQGQVLAALLLFALMELAKRMPALRDLLSTPRRKQLAVAVVAAVVVVGLGWGKAEPRELAGAALGVFLAAMGWNALRPSKSKPPAKAEPPPADGDGDDEADEGEGEKGDPEK